ncbi:glycosyltransferase [Chryseobacterium sp. 09-1422]|uniref:Glycosyltransferase n=1 Tax=Chryseobacterium kimseyorum TaxID=2984028 RepID=A0ABT3I3F0_9FLAO|nr:glycosyltransferase [Chryseobacterium kimseyorum]MCW3170514.1 glycosyltransferase [Chryseobacterium kimseyorum]
MNDVKVSIVIITYGHEKFIEQAVNGVLSQKCDFNIELIIADDCSFDNTENIVRKIIDTHPEKHIVNYTRHLQNRGMNSNLLWATNQVSGKYMALCEGDDYWTDPYKLQKQVDFLEKNLEFGLVATDFNILYESTGKIEESLFKNKPDKFPIYTDFQQFLLAAGFMAPCTWLLRKEYLPRYKKEYVDGTFPWLLGIFLKSKVHVLKDTTAVYRLLDESASHSNSLKKLYEISKGILDIQLDFIKDYELPQSFKIKVLKKYYSSILFIVILLDDKREIRNASMYIPRSERTLKNKFLFTCCKIPFGNKMLKFVHYLKKTISSFLKKHKVLLAK